MRVELSHSEVYRLCRDMRDRIIRTARPRWNGHRTFHVFGVPRGGVPVSYMLASSVGGNAGFEVVDSAEEADIIVDDLIDSGRTMIKWMQHFDHKPFFALIDKRQAENEHNPLHGKWISFPWERTESKDETVEDNVTRLLQYIGEDPDRGGLKETPKRVAAAWKHWCSGYGVDVAKIIKSFEDGADGVDEMVVVKDIPFYTHCEHHMAPFFGTATIAYIPEKKIVGLSKISRVLDVFARRLQVQERLTNQVADALAVHLQPKGVGVVLKARHLCMESRGIGQQGHVTVTSALRGVMRTTPEARAEFLALAR